MTFEEFKRKSLNGKPETKKRLDSSRFNYESYLRQEENYQLHLEDLHYFEPTELSTEDIKRVSALFDLSTLAPHQTCFFIRPSFEPSSLLLIESNERSYRNAYYTEKGVEEFESFLPWKIIGDKLDRLLLATVSQVRIPKASYGVLDGTEYLLIRKVDGNLKAAKKNSPEATSKSGKFIALMYLFIEGLQNSIFEVDEARLAIEGLLKEA